MDGEAEKKLWAVAGPQLSLVTAQQALKAGVSRRTLLMRSAIGLWQRVTVRVFCLVPTPLSREQRELAALLTLGPRAALARQSAALRLNLVVPEPKRVQLVMPNAQRLLIPDGCDVVRANNLREDDISRRHGVAVTRVGRTLLDLADCLPTAELKAAIDSALRLNPENLRWARTALQHHNRGHAGASKLRAALGEYQLEGEVPDSHLESLAQELCFVAGRRPLLHYALFSGEERIAELDFAWPEVKLGIELDGYAYHASRKSFGRDRERDRRCALLDWQIHRFVWRDVVGAPDKFRNDLIRLYDVRKSRGPFGPAVASTG